MVMERKSVKEGVKNGDAWIPDSILLPTCGYDQYVGSGYFVRITCIM